MHSNASVLVTRRASYCLGSIQDSVEANGADGGQCLRYVGQFGAEQVPVAGEEEMRKPELIDAFTLPVAPDLLSASRWRLGIPLQDRHLMAVPAEQQSRT